jgi:arsenate reductase
MLRVYAYKNCDTCRRALKFLRERGVAHQEVPIRETPPSKTELRAMLAAHDGDLRRLFNTAGGDYRAMDLKNRLPKLAPGEAIDLLAAHGNLVKRPFVIGPGVALVGFDPEEWSRMLD